MIFGGTGGSVYLQRKSLEYKSFSDNTPTEWIKLSRTIPEIIGYSKIKWTSPSVLVEWDND